MKNKRLYNFLVNTYGISKELVLELLEKRIGELELFIKNRADSLLEDKISSNSISFYIRQQVLKKLNEGFVNEQSLLSREKTALDEYIKKQVQEKIKEEVDKELKKKFNLSINLNHD